MEVFFSPKRCLQAIGDFDLFVNVVKMALDRMTANIKFFTYLCVPSPRETKFTISISLFESIEASFADNLLASPVSGMNLDIISREIQISPSKSPWIPF